MSLFWKAHVAVWPSRGMLAWLLQVLARALEHCSMLSDASDRWHRAGTRLAASTELN